MGDEIFSNIFMFNILFVFKWLLQILQFSNALNNFHCIRFAAYKHFHQRSIRCWTMKISCKMRKNNMKKNESKGMWKTRKEFTCKKTAMQLFNSCKNCIWSRLYKQWNATVKWTFSHFIGIFPTSKNDQRMSYKMQIYKLFGWKYSLTAAKSTCLSKLEFICGQWRYFHYLLKATSASLFIIWISLNILCECENCTWIPVQRFQLPTMMGYQQHNFLFWLHYFVFQPQLLRQFRQVFDV